MPTPNMQRRHFQWLAEEIAGMTAESNVRVYVARYLADCLHETNPSFDRVRFLRVFDQMRADRLTGEGGRSDIA